MVLWSQLEITIEIEKSIYESAELPPKIRFLLRPAKEFICIIIFLVVSSCLPDSLGIKKTTKAVVFI